MLEITESQVDVRELVRVSITCCGDVIIDTRWIDAAARKRIVSGEMRCPVCSKPYNENTIKALEAFFTLKDHADSRIEFLICRSMSEIENPYK